MSIYKMSRGVTSCVKWDETFFGKFEQTHVDAQNVTQHTSMTKSSFSSIIVLLTVTDNLPNPLKAVPHPE